MLRIEPFAERKEACKKDLMEILQAAIDFDSYVHEQWSFIFVTAMPLDWDMRYGFVFHNQWMAPSSDDRPLKNGDLVGMVTSPALLRDGTFNGENYKERKLIVPSRVLPQGFAARSQKT